MPISRALIVAASLALSLGALVQPTRAEACGGLFCAATPVVQAEEAIIFDVDLTNNEVTAIINIVYQGSAEEFVWVLPLQTAPDSLATGSQQAFATLGQMTAPQFRITEIEDIGICQNDNPALSGSQESSGSRGGGGGLPPADPGVQVISRKDVGPYATVVLEGTPEGVRTWLQNNGFRITEDMMRVVTPYLSKGDTLLALKLRNDRDVGEIRPIEIKMSADPATKTLEACIPIRLTAIAANTDMPITTFVFTDAGRAIPQNFFHAEPNLLKIDWQTRGSNYRQLIAAAVDEAEAGHAFVTEYAGSPSFLARSIYRPDGFDLARLRTLTDLGAFLQELADQSLLFRVGVQTVLERNFEAIAACPSCAASSFTGTPIDPTTVMDEIENDILEPDQRAQEIFDRRAHFTRLLTMLDPEEMTVDPVFSYDPELPDVSNIHEAKMLRYCGMGGAPGSAGIAFELTDGRRVYFEGQGESDREFLDAMPNATKIENLADGLVIKDNADRIEELLDGHNARNGAGCQCSATGRSVRRTSALLGALLLGLGFFLAHRRR